jgi:hypothetical protein
MWDEVRAEADCLDVVPGEIHNRGFDEETERSYRTGVGATGGGG